MRDPILVTCPECGAGPDQPCVRETLRGPVRRARTHLDRNIAALNPRYFRKETLKHVREETETSGLYDSSAECAAEGSTPHT